MTDSDILSQLDFVAALSCDFRLHGNSPLHDDGPAQFWLQLGHECPALGLDKVRVFAVCDKYASLAVLNNGEGHIISCADCGHVGPVTDFVSTWRIKK